MSTLGLDYNYDLPNNTTNSDITKIAAMSLPIWPNDVTRQYVSTPSLLYCLITPNIVLLKGQNIGASTVKIQPPPPTPSPHREGARLEEVTLAAVSAIISLYEFYKLKRLPCILGLSFLT